MYGLSFMVACTWMVFATTAVAQETKTEPTLVPGSEVDLASVAKAEWIQGEGPTAFEPGKIYVFECWATWCGPCIALIPHVDELHEKYYDQGLRVHGMNTWEDDREKVEAFVKARGEGMSYPVAFTDGSPFETEWLKAAGVEAIPHAFVVRNGKLLLATEAVRLTDSLVELMLSGDEGAKKAAAIINAAKNSSEATEKLSREIYQAKIRNNAETMAAKIKEVETLDPGHPDLAKWHLELLIVQKDWPAAIKTFEEMPETNSKNSFVAMFAGKMARGNADAYPINFVKTYTKAYEQYIVDGGDKIGPNHFAYLTILHWRCGDKENAIISADKGVAATINHKRGASEGRTNSFKRFAQLVKDGTLPEFSELTAWQIAAREEAAEKEKAGEGKK